MCNTHESQSLRELARQIDFPSAPNTRVGLSNAFFIGFLCFARRCEELYVYAIINYLDIH